MSQARNGSMRGTTSLPLVGRAWPVVRPARRRVRQRRFRAGWRPPSRRLSTGAAVATVTVMPPPAWLAAAEGRGELETPRRPPRSSLRNPIPAGTPDAPTGAVNLTVGRSGHGLGLPASWYQPVSQTNICDMEAEWVQHVEGGQRSSSCIITLIVPSESAASNGKQAISRPPSSANRNISGSRNAGVFG